MLGTDDINCIRAIFLHPKSRVTVADAAVSRSWGASTVALTATPAERATNVPPRGRLNEGVRTLTVSMLFWQRSSRRSGHDRVPFLRVSGRWLSSAGSRSACDTTSRYRRGS